MLKHLATYYPAEMSAKYAHILKLMTCNENYQNKPKLSNWKTTVYLRTITYYMVKVFL